MHQNPASPPRWPLRLMRLFLKKGYLEEIEGDMEEVFRDNLERTSLRHARLIYCWEMMKLLRPALVRNMEGVERMNNYGMLKNYFKVSLRGLVKNPLNSFINVFGLALAVGVCIFGYAFAQWTYRTDQFHENKNEVFLVTIFANREGKQQEFGLSPRPLGEMMKNDLTHITKVCRVEDRGVVLKNGDNVFREKVRYVDPEFLQMFTFPMKWGSASTLKEHKTIILSEEMAIKYFGEENPVGRDLTLIGSDHTDQLFKVTGVAEKFPESRTIDFGFLVNFENEKGSGYDYHNWADVVNATFIQLDDAQSLSSIANGMEKYREMQNKAVEPDWAITSFGFRPLATLHRESSGIREDISYSTDAKYESIGFIIIICIFILALACFNYINIAIVSATKRIKELGVRKTIGATRRVVMSQFLTENMVITAFAGIIGVLLGKFFIIPWMESINSFNMEFSLLDPYLCLYLAGVLLFTGIVSGLYPSIYVSGFQVAGILRGTLKLAKRNSITKVLLAFQLILACVLITSGVTFSWNADYMAQRPWGYDQRSTFYVAVPDQSAYEKMEAIALRNPDAISVAGAKNHLGKSNSAAIVRFPSRQVEVDQLMVGVNYLETMKVTLISGRAFREGEKNAIVVNEAMASSLELVDPVGLHCRIDSVDHEIIGVVKDFHTYSFLRKMKPTIFKVADRKDLRYLAVRIHDNKALEVGEELRTAWSGLYPGIPFDGGHQEDVWGSYFEQIKVHARVWKGFATVAIILAALGLYGLITLNVAGRTKEFSIRKILGARVHSIGINITREYVILYIAALALGIPLSYFMNSKLFDQIYWYHIPITFSGSTVAGAILVLVLLVTVATQVRSVLIANPVDGLKSE